ncbi:protein claret segregational-like isoform X2 [Crassostrea virginica]
MKIIVLFFLKVYILTEALACVDMKNTVEIVQECPRTEENWNARALLKKCNTVCSTSEYHCVINKEMTAYIEVCATPRYMQGYCAYFDWMDDKIKGMYQLDCSKFQSPCPTRYNSIEAYKYPSCYDAIKQYVTIAPTVDRTTTLNSLTVALNKTEGDKTANEDGNNIVIIVVPVVLVVVAIILGVIFWRKRRTKAEKDNTRKEDVEAMDSLMEHRENTKNEESSEENAAMAELIKEYEEKFAEMSKQIEMLKNQCEIDNQELKKKVLEQNEECKRLNNRLQEAKGNIRVLCRIKFSEENDILSTAKSTVSIKGTEKRYTFEKVFDKESTQREVYEDIKELVRSFLDGYNLCIFAYGQTGSGKTYTMEGPPGNQSEDNEGIIPRAMKQVFQTIKELKVAGWTYKLRASYIELYNEEIRDLTKGPNVQVKHEIKYPRGEQGKATITNIKEEEVENTDDALNFYRQASKNRTSGKTGRNERSSRSHAIFRVEMTGKVENVEGVNDTCSGTLTLVDLAGSEKLDDAASVTTNQETKKINLSLMELSKVLRALRKKENPFYRNSKLTYLLKNSLGGNSKTLMIVNVSPTEDCQRETKSTLEFGEEVSKVVLEKVPRKNK